jgi:hypothetical protein
MPRSASIPVLALVVMGAAQLSGAQATTSSSQGGIHAAYALLAPTPDRKAVPLARVIVAAGRACPRLAASAGPLPMTARTNPNPAMFPVEVCEAVYPFGEAVRVAGAGITLPAAPLLAQAPWIAARGNHELCSRAGPGYFYFLDPHSSLLGGELRCPAQRNGSEACPNLLFVAPYQLELGTVRLAVLDSANACDAYPNFTQIYARQFEQLPNLGAGPPTWLVTHRPIWGVDDGDAGGVQPINVALQQGLRRSGRGTLPREVGLILSGHMHRFEAVSFPAAARPPQLVIGNSGIGLSDPSEPPKTGSFRAELDGKTAKGLVANVFGYLDVRLRPDGHWHGQVVNLTLPGPSKVLASCGPSVLQAAGQVCMPGPAFPNERQAAE